MPRKLTPEQCAQWLEQNFPGMQGDRTMLLRVIDAAEKEFPDKVQCFKAFKLYWGVEGENKSLKEAGKILGVWQEQARRGCLTAARILKNPRMWSQKPEES